MVCILSFAGLLFCLFELIDKFLLQNKLLLGILSGILFGVSGYYLYVHFPKIDITSPITLSDFIILFLTTTLILITFYYARLTQQINRGK